MPFPSDEHLTPITVWTLSGGQNNISGGIDEYGGANKGRYSGRSVTNARTCATQSFGLGGSADGQAGRRGSVGATGAEESNHVSLLDPSNNGATAGTSRDCATFRWGAGDCFDSLEVRSAFLRFFVALFIHTDEEKAQIDLALGAMHGGNAAQRGRDSSGRRSSMVDRAKEYVSGSHAPPHGIEPFYLSLLQVSVDKWLSRVAVCTNCWIGDSHHSAHVTLLRSFFWLRGLYCPFCVSHFASDSTVGPLY